MEVTISGSWRGKIYYTKKDGERELLLDMEQLKPQPKITRPLAQQSPMESRNLWKDVVQAIQTKDFPTATKLKRDLEDIQRHQEKELKAKGSFYKSLFFGFLDPDAVGNGVELSKAREELVVDFDEDVKGKPFLKKGLVLPWDLEGYASEGGISK